MKKLIAFTTFAVSGLLVYCIMNNKKNPKGLGKSNDTHFPNQHHITDAFSKAKRYATESTD